jgi:hypothetical protein
VVRPWCVPANDGGSPLANGLARQWAALTGEPLPPLLQLLTAAPTALLAITRARAIASRSPATLLAFERIEHELALVTGLPRVQWPAPFVAPLDTLAGRRRAARLTTELPPLAHWGPDQQLAVLHGLPLDAPLRTALGGLLDASFGVRRPALAGLPALARLELLAVALPPHLRQRWRGGLKLEEADALPFELPPSATDDPRPEARQLLAAVFDGDGQPCPVAGDRVTAVAPALAVDLLVAGLVLRTTLRLASGELQRELAAARVRRAA